MRNVFDEAFDLVMKDEGGYVNDPDDHGGATKYGVTIGTLKTWLGHEATVEDVQAIDVKTAKQIYRFLYWDALKLDSIKSPSVAIAMMNTCVLYGVGTTARLAQVSANCLGSFLTIDGHVGPITADAINRYESKKFLSVFVAQIFERINDLVMADPVKSKYRTGWTARATRLLSLKDS